MRGYHPEEINLLDDEELDNLIYTLNEEKKFRKEQKIEILTDELENLFQKIADEGFHLIYLGGYEYIFDTADWKIE